MPLLVSKRSRSRSIGMGVKNHQTWKSRPSHQHPKILNSRRPVFCGRVEGIKSKIESSSAQPKQGLRREKKKKQKRHEENKTGREKKLKISTACFSEPAPSTVKPVQHKTINDNDTFTLPVEVVLARRQLQEFFCPEAAIGFQVLLCTFAKHSSFAFLPHHPPSLDSCCKSSLPLFF